MNVYKSNCKKECGNENCFIISKSREIPKYCPFIDDGDYSVSWELIE